MSKINVLAVREGTPILTKSALRDALTNGPELVKFVPVTPSPALVSTVSARNLPATVTAHSPHGRVWSAIVTRKGDKLSVK